MGCDSVFVACAEVQLRVENEKGSSEAASQAGQTITTGCGRRRIAEEPTAKECNVAEKSRVLVD